MQGRGVKNQYMCLWSLACQPVNDFVQSFLYCKANVFLNPWGKCSNLIMQFGGAPEEGEGIIQSAG